MFMLRTQKQQNKMIFIDNQTFDTRIAFTSYVYFGMVTNTNLRNFFLSVAKNIVVLVKFVNIVCFCRHCASVDDSLVMNDENSLDVRIEAIYLEKWCNFYVLFGFYTAMCISGHSNRINDFAS